jgi:hypothetical protein
MVVRSIDEHRARGDIGFPTPASRSPFLAAPAVCLPAPSPVLLRTRDHPPVDFTPSTECFPSLTCRREPLWADHRAPPLGLRSLFATSAVRVVVPGFQARHLSVLGVSHALDGFIREQPCGFISPRSHVQGSPSRVFPSRTAKPARHRPVPSRRLATVDYWSCPQRHLPSPRPQGFESVRRVRNRRASFTRCANPIPSWASPPPGAHSPNRERTSNRPFSARDVGLAASPTAS